MTLQENITPVFSIQNKGWCVNVGRELSPILGQEAIKPGPYPKGGGAFGACAPPWA